MRRTASGSYEASPGIAGDPIVVDLWPGATPRDVGIEGQENTRIYDSPLTGPTRLITNVTRPRNEKLPASWTGLCLRWLVEKGLLDARP